MKSGCAVTPTSCICEASFNGGQYPSSMTDDSNAGFQRACVVFSARFADSWDLERTLRLRSQEVEHPYWSAATRENIRSGRIRVGMTHAMIAWMLGYPSVYGTEADLDRLNVWHYERPGPDDETIYFSGDGLVRYDPPPLRP